MDIELTNEQRLWMNISTRRRGGASTVLPRLMREIMENLKSSEENVEETDILFPSNYEWRTNIYLKLLAKQREAMEQKNSGRTPSPEVMDDDLLQESQQVLHDWNIVPNKEKKPPFCAPDAARLKRKEYSNDPGPITWTVSDIAKAGRLLCTPPLETDFADEQEMRRVYTLIYDVYRYKNILNQALKDVGFFFDHKELKDAVSRVWLLLYDLYHRNFKKRTGESVVDALTYFKDAGLADAEEALWRERIKLAAAVARLRIKHCVLKLCQLLPHHLRDERSHGQSSPVTCWVNIRKIKNEEDLVNVIRKTLKARLVSPEDHLDSDCCKWDAHCPQFIIFHPSLRTVLAKSSLIQKHKLIVQDRSFCLGPATFGKIIANLQLTGSVVQSHVNSPRTTAYLASLLSQNDNIKKLLAFSAGNKKNEYESYFNDLGIKNILIFSEKLIDMPPDSSSLEEVIAVFATPPNSYSAVADPIDLVCSRGGDLSMLEVLTETEDTPEGRQRVAGILEEQKKTLKFAMSRPQIQFVLYETHSEIDAENVQMVEKTVSEMNKFAKMHHAAMQGKLKQIQALEEADEKEINNNLLLEAAKRGDGEEFVPKNTVGEQKAKLLNNVFVPDCDIFDTPSIPELCPSIDPCLKLSKEGCYLALVQRKQVTKLDNKYMIQMAETRGLFGNEAQNKKNNKAAKKKAEVVETPQHKVKKLAKDIEIDRIAAPTMSSIAHSKLTSSTTECLKRADHPKVPQSRRWWTETTRHITNLRASLSKQKIIPSVRTAVGGSTPSVQSNTKRFVDTLVRRTRKVDEIVAKSSSVTSNVPVYPKLRLTRLSNKFNSKVPIPISVTMVTFPSQSFPVSYRTW